MLFRDAGVFYLGEEELFAVVGSEGEVYDGVAGVLDAGLDAGIVTLADLCGGEVRGDDGPFADAGIEQVEPLGGDEVCVVFRA